MVLAKHAIYISYLGKDSTPELLQLDGLLKKAFGAFAVFRNQGLSQGELRAALQEAEIGLVVIGPGWSKSMDQPKDRADLHQPDKFVRLEVATLLGRRLHFGQPLPVLCVFLGGAELSRMDNLPDEIKTLAGRDGLRLELGTGFHDSVLQLIERITWILADYQLQAAAVAGTKEIHLTLPRLSQLPKSVAQLMEVQILDVRDNQLTALPESMGQLKQLQSLEASHNQLTALPESLGQLTQLMSLNIDYNHLSTLPECLGQLRHLQNLNVYYNQLKALPECLVKLPHLQSLDVGANLLTILPEWLSQLPQLQILAVRYNQLTTLPATLGQFARLEILDLSNNQLTALPESLKQLSSLKELYLHGNNALAIQPEVLGPTWEEVTRTGKSPASPAAILDYYFRMRRGRRPLNEAKLILVGRGGVGKTCLIKRLVHDTFDEHEPETPGINIQPWEINLHDGDSVRLHVWDFGGQRILHGTHTSSFSPSEPCTYWFLVVARTAPRRTRNTGSN